MKWLIPANRNNYDLDGVFKEFGYVDWTQRVNYKLGDIVYIYITLPVQEIQYKTIVRKIDLTYEESINDESFWKTGEAYERGVKDKYVRLEFLEEFNTKKLSLNALMEHGLKAAPQSPIRLLDETSKYIQEVTELSHKNLFTEYKEWTAENQGIKVGNWYGPKLKRLGTELRELNLYPDYKSNFFEYKSFDEYKKVYKEITGETEETIQAIIKGKNKVYPVEFRENAKEYRRRIAQKEYDSGQRSSPQNFGGIPALGAVLRSYLKFLYFKENPLDPIPDIDDDDTKIIDTEDIKYDKSDFLKDVFIEEKEYEIIRQLLKHKKNIIIQGAPGVGKTYASKRLAWSIMEVKDESRIEMIQFHQNYSYEDFVLGYKPAGEGFTLQAGIFMNFCTEAEENPSQEYFLIIDEINRGNLSKIFGELLMLIEPSYRGEQVKLPYNKEPFSIPENLYIIGMMNTADRSLAMIDYALRRRFSFYEMTPGFKTEGFIKYQSRIDSKNFNHIIDLIILLNDEISEDPTLGAGFRIGHSYFILEDENEENFSETWLKNVIHFDILPMLTEYWFDDLEKVESWANNFIEVIENES